MARTAGFLEGTGPVDIKTGEGGSHRKPLMSEGWAGERGKVWVYYVSGKQGKGGRKEPWT